MNEKVLNEDLSHLLTLDYIPYQKLKNKNILITGCTGLVGYNMLNALVFLSKNLDLNLTIHAIVRDKTKLKEIFSDQLLSYDKLFFIQEEIKNYPMKKDGQKIPLLEEVFEAVDGRVPVLIEIKSLSFFNRRLEKILLETVEKYKGKNIVAIQSFNVFSVKYLIKHGAQYPIGQLYSMPNFIIITFKNDKLVFKGFNPPDFIAYDVRKLPEKLLHKDKPAQDFPILIWTVNSNNARIKATNFGNNIIFENIDPEEKNDKQSR